MPDKLFDNPTSTLLLSKEGRLMNAKIADDGQWRFPEIDSVPYKFEKAIIAYEDKDFYSHIGISFKAIGRAVLSNLKAGQIVSGGSTITMQIARMSRKGKRNIWNKTIEAIWAVRLELKYSKKELIEIYAANAPFGGNVVGLEAAAWRYFNQPPQELSWSEMATLAVLPNAPSLVHPGKNRGVLLKKRNDVLKKLLEDKIIDELTYELSLEEPLIDAPKNLPSLAPHLLERAVKSDEKGKRIRSTLSYNKQEKLIQVINRHQQYLKQSYINNSALLVIDAKTNEVVTYIGNTATENDFQKYVDLIQSYRSSGSILKPFLYAAMIQEGMLNYEQLVPDVPLHFNNFSPKNYDGKYEGAVKAGTALAKSLNVPAVYLLKQYGVDKFLHVLRDINQKNITKSSEYYGLSLILGGAETSLWNIANAYSGMVKTLNYYNEENKYRSDLWEEAQWIADLKEKPFATSKTASKFDAGAIYETFQALLSVNRPYLESAWEKYSSSVKIAWKTGTSFGNRDAWAVGCTPQYVVAVWVGNATGEGRPGIIGTSTAGTIMFDVFAHLNIKKEWFKPPFDELTEMEICDESGFRSTQNCTKTTVYSVHRNALKGKSCNFHVTFITDEQERYRFHRNCAGNMPLKTVTRFVLPPLQAYFYKNTNPNYKTLPAYHPDCGAGIQEQTFYVVYPSHNSKLIGTIDLDGTPKGIVFEASHPDPKARLFWHIDGNYLGETTKSNKITYYPKKGKHQLTVLDEFGNQKKIEFTVLDE